MYEVILYEDAQGNSPVGNLIDELDQKGMISKDARVQLKQIMFHIDLLETLGTRVGEKHVKHIEGEIWEIRPGHNRILFYCWNGQNFVLLHHFRKTTQKTPPQEIERAIKNMNDWNRRHGL